ncbi:unnamed protein product [Protopolystoma xenopodis]|uniref:Uncharacterized protein n=1 Tax=Protopolystoma xenopodis TaxID=117903 RepID=A0A3S5AWY8_9PLAT|nr:unnamed protein product [Protopolystoma xenopodis]
MLNCHGSTPAEGVDKTDASSKLQFTSVWMRTTSRKAMENEFIVPGPLASYHITIWATILPDTSGKGGGKSPASDVFLAVSAAGVVSFPWANSPNVFNRPDLPQIVEQFVNSPRTNRSLSTGRPETDRLCFSLPPRRNPKLRGSSFEPTAQHNIRVRQMGQNDEIEALSSCALASKDV